MSLMRKITVCFLVLAILGLTGHGELKTAQGRQPAAGDLIYTIADAAGDWGFPSPYGHYARGPGYIRMSLIFDTLVWKDDKGYLPALALSWKYNREDNSHLFTLRDNVRWHDGRKFTARDVVFTVNYTKEHPYSWSDTSIIRRVEAQGDHVVKIFLDKPYAPFMEYVAVTLPILPEHIWKDVKTPAQFQQKEALIGTGPFTLADYNKAQGTYQYKAFAGYYQGQPRVAELRFIKMTPEVMAAALRQKQVNAAPVVPELMRDLEREGFRVLVGKHDWVAKLMINHQKAPFNRKEFRQALAYAIDRQALVETCLRGHGLAGQPGFLAVDSKWYNPVAHNRYPYSPDKVAELLRGLGYEKRRDYFEKDGQLLELELLFSGRGIGVPGSPAEREAEMIKMQLEKAGFKVTLRSLEAKTLDSRIGEWKFDLALSGHGGMGSDPETLNRNIAGRGFNSARYHDNEALNAALKQQQAVTDRERRAEIVKKIQELYAEEMPALPLYYPTWHWAHDGQVNLFFTYQGVGSGVPQPVNKMSFVR